ncbi:cadmium resistance transporter [uncultured Secundilactobacillus sp.]|uniref:cadmium resistance transporter n=1 Tax=uncultured Secundilactobacillus sp. TaxID=2813935 RepID=UPI00258DA4EF|nr:cadmium resistance transporter [uncultured Secundilactobacillus sp.]
MMFREILFSIVVYFSSAIDLITVLILLYTQNHHRSWVKVYLGQLIGSLVLLLISLLFAFILHSVPSPHLIGLLGLIPLVFGYLSLKSHQSEATWLNSMLTPKFSNHLMISVAVLTIGSTGSDNIGIFTAYFSNIASKWLPVVILTFIVCMFAIGIIGYCLSFFPGLATLFTKYGTLIMGVTYIIMGIVILVKNHTISYFLHLLVTCIKL